MDKVFYLDSVIQKKAITKGKQGLKIAGYANTVDRDRTGDVIIPEAWAKGVDNYRLNPVLLFQHKADQPIGSVNSIRVDKRGIHVDASISDTRPDIQTLVKEGHLKAFSVGFRVKDQKTDRSAQSSIITEVELLEISIVSVPANQTSLFSVRKSFDTDEEYLEFCSKTGEIVENIEDAIKLSAGITTLANEHYHTFELDENGNGVTTYTSHGENDHVHVVENSIIKEIHGHTHDKIATHDVSNKNDVVFEVNFETEEKETEMANKTDETVDGQTESETEVEVEAETEENVALEAAASEGKANEETSELEEDEDLEEVNPYEPIPFQNLLNEETSRIELRDFVKLNKKRYTVKKVASSESPTFQFKEVDINGNEKEEVRNIPATSLSVINEWDIGKGYDLILQEKNFSTELTENLREEIKSDFTELVNMSEKELYDLKTNENISNNELHRSKLNKLLNLKSTPIKEWTDTNFIAAANICDNIKNLKAINLSEAGENSESNLALSLHGHKVVVEDKIKEIEEMATQTAGDPVVVNTKADEPKEAKSEPVQVSEPQVAQLEEKAGKVIEAETLAQARAEENGRYYKESDEFKELMNEVRQTQAELNALKTSRMEYTAQQRNDNPFTKKEMADAYFLAKARGMRDDESLFDTKIGARMKAVTTVDAFLSNFSDTMQEELEQELIIAPMLSKVQVDARNFRVPVADEDANLAVAQFASGTFATGIADATNVPTSSQNTLSAVTFTPHKFMAATHIALDEEEDTVLPLVGFLRQGAARRMARSIDKSLLRGDGSLSGFTAIPTGYTSVITGMVSLAEAVAGDGLKVFTGANATQASALNIATARATMGKYGISVGTNDLVYVTSIEGYNELVQTADFRTVDTFGDMATYHTGILGAIWGIPVMVSEFMDNKGATTTSNNSVGALIYKPGFLVAERRGILVETEYEPRQQVNAIYMSTRLDMKALTTVASAALSNTYSMAVSLQTGDGTI